MDSNDSARESGVKPANQVPENDGQLSKDLEKLDGFEMTDQNPDRYDCKTSIEPITAASKDSYSNEQPIPPDDNTVEPDDAPSLAPQEIEARGNNVNKQDNDESTQQADEHNLKDVSGATQLIVRVSGGHLVRMIGRSFLSHLPRRSESNS